MGDDVFARLLAATMRHRGAVLAAAGAATLLGIVVLLTVPIEEDVSVMLPTDEEVRRSMDFLQESDLSDKVVVSLGVEPEHGGLPELLSAVQQLRASLGPPLVTKIETGVSAATVTAGIDEVMARTPELVRPGELEALEERLDRDGVNGALRDGYRQLVRPGEMFTQKMLRADPLGLSGARLQTLQELSESIGYEVEIEQGSFVSRDRQHALVLLETPVRITESEAGRELFAYLDQKLAALPHGITADVVAGHLHTISNEDIMRSDIVVALGAASLGFLALFLWLYRDPRAITLFLLPVASVVVAIAISGLVAGRLSGFVVGMGGVVAGIAIDYAIHVYMAIRAAGGNVQIVAEIARPLVTGALTTLGIFVAFLFSTVPGYQQLGLFSMASIAICVAFSLFVLPLLVGGRDLPQVNRVSDVLRLSPGAERAAVVVWVGLVILGIASLGDLKVRTDLQQFDGTEEHILEAERSFERTWGGGVQPAVLVASGSNLDEALRQNELLYDAVVAESGPEGFASVAPIWPSRARRAENRTAWVSFWREGREERFRRLLEELGPGYGFSRAAFDPFFEGLYPVDRTGTSQRAVFPGVGERFTRETDDGVQVFSFFPDEPEWLENVRQIAGEYPGAFVVSRGGLGGALSRSVSREVRYLAGLAAIILPGLAFLLLRDLRLTLLSLVPVGTSLLAVLAIPAAVGWSLTAPAMIAAMIVVGLSIDYGIFMVYACHQDLHAGTTSAVALSATSTLVATAALALSRHPVLFSVGMTMVTGISAGFASSLLVVPPLYDRLVAREGRS